MSTYCKIFLQFENRFWENNKMYLWFASDKRGYFPCWMVLKPPKNSNLNLICAMLVDEEAKRVERMNEEDLKDELQNFLFSIYGQQQKKDKSVYRPIKMHVRKWDTDPRYCGSYSFLKVKAF